MKISEYDAFGPWIYRIDEEHEVPRYFRPYVDEGDNAIFRLKVPKKIERRDATADMDLYEYLLNVYEDRLELMQIADEGIRMQKVPFNKVCAVTLYRSLLLGRLTVYLGDDMFTFEYNAVSQDLIMDVVAAIRKGFQAAGEEDTKAYDPSQLKFDDLFFVNEWVRLEPAERPFVHCAYQPTKTLTGEQKLYGSLHMEKKSEWIILKKREEYAFEYLYLPRTAGTSIQTGFGTEFSGIVKLVATSGNYSTEVLYESDNKDMEEHYRA